MGLLFSNYKVTLRLIRPQLGTNPMDGNVMDMHIIEKQRKLIMEKSKINKAVDAKYADAPQISDETKRLQLEALIKSIEDTLGRELSEEERQGFLSGKLNDLDQLKEDFKNISNKGTVFFRNENNMPCIGSHMILGFLKAAAESIARTLPKKNGTIPNSTTYTCSIINQHCSVSPELIPFDKDVARDESGAIKYLQRSLRAMTAQGPRISLAKSEMVEAGATLTFTIKVLANSPLEAEHIRMFLSYGELKGLGQWRNADYGKFELVDFSE